MLVQTMPLDNNMYTLGSLLGVHGHQEVLREISQNSGGSFFGSENDPFRQGFQTFMTTVVEPIRASSNKIATVVTEMVQPDRIKPITSVKELAKGVPPSMWLPIVYYEPIRAMLDDGIIDGFGIDPDKLDKEDPYENACISGAAVIHSTTIDADGKYDIHYVWDSGDPDLTPEEMLAIRETRRFLDEFLKDERTKYLDPTDYPNLHG